MIPRSTAVEAKLPGLPIAQDRAAGDLETLAHMALLLANTSSTRDLSSRFMARRTSRVSMTPTTGRNRVK